MTPAGAKMISALSAKVTIPALLFSSVLPSVDGKLIGAAWPMLLLPLVYVAVGAGVGKLAVLVCKPPEYFHNGVSLAQLHAPLLRALPQRPSTFPFACLAATDDCSSRFQQRYRSSICLLDNDQAAALVSI